MIDDIREYLSNLDNHERFEAIDYLVRHCDMTEDQARKAVDTKGRSIG